MAAATAVWNKHQRRLSYFFTSVCWLATHCQFPLGIFTQVSVQRSYRSIFVPSPSTPFPVHEPVAMAVSP